MGSTRPKSDDCQRKLSDSGNEVSRARPCAFPYLDLRNLPIRVYDFD